MKCCYHELRIRKVFISNWKLGRKASETCSFTPMSHVYVWKKFLKNAEHVAARFTGRHFYKNSYAILGGRGGGGGGGERDNYQ